MFTELKSLEPVMKREVKFKGVQVVPSKWYSDFCGKEVKYVNRSIRTLAEQNRLKEGNDYYRLSAEMVQIEHHDFLDSSDPKYGVYLLTLKAVNTLSHYFDDPKSIELSKEVNNRATESMEDEYSDDPIITTSLNIVALRKGQIRMSKQLDQLETKVENIDNSIKVIQEKLPTAEPREYKFPEGCITRGKIRALYFPGISKEVIGQHLKAIGWPTKVYIHLDDDNVVHKTDVNMEEGLDMVYTKFLMDSTFESENVSAYIMRVSTVGTYHIKKGEIKDVHFELINKDNCIMTYRATKQALAEEKESKKRKRKPKQ